MKSKKAASFITIALILTALLSVLSTLPTIQAQNASLTYKLANPADGSFSITLNVEVPQTLNDYYQSLPHRSASDGDFPKFVTPYAVKPIADAMRQIYPVDEDFANGVLTLVHQITYNETLPEFYPIETLKRNNGDCDMFSLLAASILKAGDLDVVLLHYSNEEHMNIGIHLNVAPKDARLPIYSLENNNVTYYVAECTSSTWKEGWRVGECPDDLKNAPVSIITLENSEQVSPGQVIAGFTKLNLNSTSLGISLSPPLTIEGNGFNVNGQIYPPVPNEEVTLYASVNGAPWTIMTNVTTQSNGHFSYEWKQKEAGALMVRASWAGNNNYIGATSQNSTAFILPLYLVELSVATIIAAVLCITIYRLTGKSRREQKIMEIPQTEQTQSEQNDQNQN